VRFHAPSRADWTAWLEKHHASAQEVFLVFYRKECNRACITYDEAVEEALCFGWIDGVKHKLDDQRYTYRFTPRRPRSKWSDSNKARVARLAAAGKLRAAGLAAIELAKQTGAWNQLAAQPTTEELEEALRAIASTISKCEKVEPKLRRGTSQHTLLARRIKALRIAAALIERELGSHRRPAGAKQARSRSRKA
jgi:uncharacterized protein YdeI (YjbR/CyaY-like superfamily)